MKSNRIAIVGAGFSGLTLAWALQKQGLQVEVYESDVQAGGLIKPCLSPVLVESAAHALLANEEVEQLAKDLDFDLVHAGFVSKNKWIYRSLSGVGKPRRWPLTSWETVKAIHWPSSAQENQTVQDWCCGTFGQAFNDFLLSPALQGVYGAQSSELSAKLVFGARKFKVRRGRFRGSVAPRNGMQELIEKLAGQVKIHYQQDVSIESLQSEYKTIVLAVPMAAAGELLSSRHSELGHFLKTAPRVSLTSATVVFEKPRLNLQGFGCLFPKNEGFESLGVLFNSDLFEGRITQAGTTSETWIFAGKMNQESDEKIIEKIQIDRARLGQSPTSVQFSKVYKWPKVLPLYGLELEKGLRLHFKGRPILERGAWVDDNLCLTGNYFGALGLSKILNYNLRLARQISQNQRESK